jgi:UDP:flavonoid glycosyltransferase YjiC (YdhE family)
MPAIPQAQTAKYVHFSDRMTESLMNINKVVQENKTTLDSIQNMAVELTRAIRALEAAAIKYIKMADKVLETIVPVLKNLPIVGKEVLEFASEAQAGINTHPRPYL